MVYDGRDYNVGVSPIVDGDGYEARYMEQLPDGNRVERTVDIPKDQTAVFIAAGRRDSDLVKVVGPSHLTESSYAEPDAWDWQEVDSESQRPWDGWRREGTPLRVLDIGRAYDEANTVKHYEDNLSEVRAQLAAVRELLDTTHSVIEGFVEYDLAQALWRALRRAEIDAQNEVAFWSYRRGQEVVIHRIGAGVLQEVASSSRAYRDYPSEIPYPDEILEPQADESELDVDAAAGDAHPEVGNVGGDGQEVEALDKTNDEGGEHVDDELVGEGDLPGDNESATQAVDEAGEEVDDAGQVVERPPVGGALVEA